MHQSPPADTPDERDEPVKIDLDPEEALKALLKVDPDAPLAQDQPERIQREGEERFTP